MGKDFLKINKNTYAEIQNPTLFCKSELETKMLKQNSEFYILNKK